jgi:hypothetical protein
MRYTATIFRLALLSILVALCVTSGCCTATMMVIGHSSDKNASPYKNISGCQIGSLEPETAIELFVSSGDSFGGKYLGLKQYSPEEYKKLYNDSVAINPKTQQMPYIDDTICIFIDNQPAHESIFKGFGYKFVDEPSFIKNENLITSYSILCGSPNNEKISRDPLANLNMVINRDSDTLDGSLIRKLMLSGQLPAIDYAEIQLTQLDKTIQIPKIDSIQTLKDNNSSTTLILIGLAVDVILFNAWMHDMGHRLQ